MRPLELVEITSAHGFVGQSLSSSLIRKTLDCLGRVSHCNCERNSNNKLDLKSIVDSPIKSQINTNKRSKPQIDNIKFEPSPIKLPITSDHGKMGKQFKFFNDKDEFRCRNLLPTRGMPFVYLIAICFLIIANIRCDHVGSANVLQPETLNSIKMERNKDNGKNADNENHGKAQLAANELLREIYLDSNSKIISFIAPASSASDQVQKFHPNGRYGRRSVDNSLAEPAAAHVELAKLRSPAEQHEADGPGQFQTLLANALARGQRQRLMDGKLVAETSSSQDPANYELDLELGKLLKCNYTGMSNLYWCDNGS